MQDHELKQKLQDLEVPPPSDGAEERAINLAMQAFKENAKKRQGFAFGGRLISANQLIRSLTMKKAYALAGSFAALATVLAITTIHYNDIMGPVTQPMQPQKVVTTNPSIVTAAPPQLFQEEAKQDANVNPPAYIAPPPPPPPAPYLKEETKKGAVINRAAPGMQAAAPVAAASPPVVYNAQGGSRGTKDQYAADAGAAAGSEGANLPRDRMEKTMRVAGGISTSMTMAPGMPRADIMPYPYPPNPQYTGGDKFQSFADNPVKQVAQEPVSTFSIDVDTSSYSFVRRLLNQGQLPQKDMVRVEEMINYFPYDYALPESKSEPFKPTVAVYQTPWNANTKLVHIGIKGYDMKASKPHSNLVFLIDVSGSMNEPTKLPWVKASLKMLVDQLDGDDTIGIVTYAGYSGVALEPTKGSNKQLIDSVIDQLGAGGSTAGAQGIQDAYVLAMKHFDKNAVNRVILATDGDFNVGISDQTQLKNLIEQKRDSGIYLSILGFGMGNYNDALMQTLAQYGNGNAAYIDNLNEARKVLVDEANSTLFTIAKDVKIQVEFNPALVSEYRLVGYESRLLKREDFNNDKIDAGEVGAGHAVTAIYEITPVGSPKQVDDLRYQSAGAKLEAVKTDSNFSGEYGFLKIRYKLPSETESKLITAPIGKSQEASNILQESEDVRFATAVAAFGQLLRGDQHVSGYSYDDIIALADGARGKDESGYRKEFVGLVQEAKSLHSVQPPVPVPAPGVPPQPCIECVE